MAYAVEFDFATKRDRLLTLEEVGAACGAGRHCWLDLESADSDRAGKILGELGVNERAIAEALGPEREGRFDLYDQHIHFAVTEARHEDGSLVSAHVDVILGQHYLVTIHHKPARFVEAMKATCHDDFVKFSKSPGFLLYEIGDHLVRGYRACLGRFSDEVERVEEELFGHTDDTLFRRVSELTRQLLAFRKMLTGASEVMRDLSTRRSSFISETTQGYLDKHADSLDRLAAGLAGEREMLAEALNLYMGMVGHRTNQIVKRLTIISIFFLPLTFLCGVYGMNFQVFPEVGWRYGYLLFWGLVLMVATGLWLLLKRLKWL